MTGPPIPDATPVGDVVQCSDVHRIYGAGATAVDAVSGVTCRVPAGARIALTGPSGSGKSTLLHLIAGLDHPSRGTVTWPARDTDHHGSPWGIGLIFQGASLIDDLDVAENVCLPMVFQGASGPEATRRAEVALAAVGIAELARRLPAELSSGQAQRVAIARVLALRPQLILADEPTGRLDRRTAEHVITALLEVADTSSAAVVIATHDDAVASRLPTRWSLRDGRLRTGA